MNSKFDPVTAKKLINEYGEKINIYLRENKVLKSQLEDLKTTLKINKEMLHKHMNENKKGDTAVLSQLKDENTRLCKKMDELYADKANLEKKLYKTQQAFEDRMSSDREIIERLNEKLFLLENKIKEKVTSLEVTKSELQKYVTNENLKKFRHVFIVDPNKANIDLNNELNYTRDILAKISKLMNTEKMKSENMQSQISNLQNELNLYRKNNKAFMIDCLANNIKLDSIDLDEQSEDEIDLELGIDSDVETKLDSPSLQFPDKVSMGHSMNSNFSKKTVPKLDFTKVQAKYKSNNMKVDFKNLQIKDHDKLSENVTSVNKNTQLDEEKKDIKLRMALNINEKLRGKVEKYKNSYRELKEKFLKLSNTLKLAQSKIDVLESHMKKGIGLNVPSTEDTMNKRNMNNTSMNANTSVREDMYFDEEDVVQCTIKEMKEKKKF